MWRMPLRVMRFMAMGGMVPRLGSVQIDGTDQKQ
jgi:hypothetical protein